MERERNEAADRSDLPPVRGQSVLISYLLRATAFLPIAVVTVVVVVIKDRVEDLQTVGYFGIFLINVVGSGTFILPVPGIAAAIVGATIWNPLLVGVAGATGSTIGEIAGYLAGVGSQRAVQRFVGNNRWYERIVRWIQRRGALTIFVFAATPTPFFDVAGFAAGTLRYPIGRFVVACWLGKIVKYVILSLAAFWGADLVYSWFD